MDKFKIYVAAAIKNRFWILCGLVVVLGLGSWYAASASLSDTTRKSRKEIDDAFNKAKELLGKGISTTKGSAPMHPNTKTKEETDKLIASLEAKVVEAWTKQYGYQGEEIFVWPAELTQTPRFLNAVQGLRPIESIPTNYEINVDFRGAYRDYIKKELPRLAEIIGARWDPGSVAGSGGQGGIRGGSGFGGVGGGGIGGGSSDSKDEAEVDDKSLVDWSKENQAYFQNVRLNWNHMPDEAPNTLQMLYAQEDLWVLQALLTIISKTNGDADSRHNAAIRRIDSILLGADAVKGTSSVTKLGGGAAPVGNSGTGPGGQNGMTGLGGGGPSQPGGAGGTGAPPGGGMQPGAPGGGGVRPGAPGGSAGAGPGGMSPGGMSPGGAGGLSGGQASGGAAPAANAADPAEGRYVDKDYKALSAAELRGASSSQLPEMAYLAVAKRMPIRLSLIMDQNKLNTFLVECGNSPLTVEVRQVRFNRTAAAGSGSGGGSGGGGGGPTGVGASGGAGGFGAGGGRGNRGFGANSGKGDEGSVKLNPHPWDRPVEIYGIVYIYNPVDAEKLKLKATSAGPLAASSPPANTRVAPGSAGAKPAGGGVGGVPPVTGGAASPGGAGPGGNAAAGGLGAGKRQGAELTDE